MLEDIKSVQLAPVVGHAVELAVSEMQSVSLGTSSDINLCHDENTYLARNFPFPRPPRMPPRQPRMPGRNTQFQMPFFGSQYGRMNPYAGQFSGYGVPSNMFSASHYQPYVPPPPQPSAPPVQLRQIKVISCLANASGTPHLLLLPLVVEVVALVDITRSARRQFGGR